MTVRPSFGLPLALIGTVLAVLGFVALDWTDRADFFQARTAVGDSGSSFNPFTQVYMLALWLPLLAVTAAVGVLVTLGPVPARVGTAAAGVLGGLAVIGLVLVVEGGAIGTAQSRSDAGPVLIAIAAAGVVSIGLGIGAFRERRGVFARALAGVLAVVAALAHAAVVNDVFADNSDAAFGAWAPSVGFALIAVAAAVPHRRGAAPVAGPAPHAAGWAR